MLAAMCPTTILFHFTCQDSQYFDGQDYAQSATNNLYPVPGKVGNSRMYWNVANRTLGFRHMKFPCGHSSATCDFISFLPHSKLFIKLFTRSAPAAEVGCVCQAPFLSAQITTEQQTDSLGCHLLLKPAIIIKTKGDSCLHEYCFKPFTKVSRNVFAF